MKNEFIGEIMTRFVALRAKMYAYRKLNKDKKKAKVKKCVQSIKVLPFTTIRSACLTVKKYTENKCCLRIRNTRSAR